jgi:hypothetical protein
MPWRSAQTCSAGRDRPQTAAAAKKMPAAPFVQQRAPQNRTETPITSPTVNYAG